MTEIMEEMMRVWENGASQLHGPRPGPLPARKQGLTFSR